MSFIQNEFQELNMRWVFVLNIFVMRLYKYSMAHEENKFKWFSYSFDICYLNHPIVVESGIRQHPPSFCMKDIFFFIV
jgi:hypothetical protein